MPNRVIRDGILTSDRVNALSLPAELFYRRLMSVVDDFGRYDARPAILRAQCYPLRLDTVTADAIAGWLDECVAAKLVIVYDVDGRKFLEMLDFAQRVRVKRERWPAPPDGGMTVMCPSDDGHMTDMRPSNDGLNPNPNPNKKLMSSSPEKPANVDVVPLPSQAGKPSKLASEASEVLAYLNEKTGRRYRPTATTLRPIMARLKEGYKLAELKAVVDRKFADWSNDAKMRPYLRPATLFGAEKFAQYVGEIGQVDEPGYYAGKRWI